MMKMKRIFAAVLTTALAAMALTGCGSASSSDTWKIGGIGPITGGAAIYGNAAMNGAQIAVDEINAAGGIAGKQIEFKVQDDEHDAEKAVNAYNTLKDWGMNILYGTVTTAPCLAVGPEANADGMFMITPSASSTKVLEDANGNNYGNVFQVCFTDPNQGVASAQYIAENNVAKTVAIIYNSADAYSSGITATFKTKAAELGLEVVAEGSFTDDSKTDFTVQLQSAKDANAELLFLPFYYQEAAIVLQQAKDMGYAPIFWGVDGMDGILTLEGFDTSLAEDVVLLTPFAADATDDLTVKFVTTYQEKYGDIPNQFAADGYDAIYAIKAAIEKSGATTDMSVSDLGAALSQAMVDISVDGLTGESMKWSANGEVSKGPRAVVIKDGAYVSMQ